VITAITVTSVGSGYTNPIVTITDASGTGATAAVAASFTAALITSFSTAGAQNLTAIYNGDATFASSNGLATVTVAANATATITPSANNVPVGSTPTYTVTMNGNAALGSPAGTVQFFLDGVALGSVQTLTAGGGNTSTASVVSTALGAGSHFVTVRYTATGATNPYTGFTVDTSTSTNGAALIETAQQAFTPGNLIVVQRGDGSVNLGSSGYLVFLDEYTPGGTLVQRIAMPNLDSGSTHALLLSGQNGAEGLLNRSADGYFLTLAGYDVAVGQQFVTSTFPFQFPRTVARVNRAGTVDTSTAISTTSSSSIPYNPLDVVSQDGNEFWLASNLNVGNTTESGIEYIGSVGATTATQIAGANTQGTSLGIAGGQLYAASTDLSNGEPVGIWHVGTGLPTTSSTLAGLPGLADAYQNFFPNAQNPKQLLFFNHNDGTSNNPDTLFIADQSFGLLKFYFDGTNWVFGNGNPSTPFGEKLVFAGGATGVAGFVVNPGPNAQFQLYVTGSNIQGQNPNQIAAFLDTNAYNNGFAPGSFSTVALVGATGSPPSPNGNENFAGLAWAPGYQTTTVLTSSSNPALVGTSIIFTATVTATTGIPTGVVSFFDGSTLLGTGTLNGAGVATFTTSTLAVGSHSITAFYNGDVKDGTNTSNTVTQVIMPGGSPQPAPPPGGGVGGGNAPRPAGPGTGDGAGNGVVLATPGKPPFMADELRALTGADGGDSAVGSSAAPLTTTEPTNPGTQPPDVGDVGQGTGVTVDEFWRLLGTRGPKGVSLWSLGGDGDGSIGG
jgi:hypothetical protein